MKLAIAKWLVSLIEPAPSIGWIIGLVMISRLITVKSKGTLFCLKNSHAAVSALVFETLYPRTGSFRSTACSAVTCHCIRS